MRRKRLSSDSLQISIDSLHAGANIGFAPGGQRIIIIDTEHKMDEIKRYRAFLDNGKTERECIKEIISLAEAEGYRNIESVDKLKAGDKVYYVQYAKSIALFRIGSAPIEKGMNILGAHIDSPRLDVKMNPLYENEGIVYLDTHYYGGIKKYQWLTLPLAIHGIAVSKDGTKKEIVLGEDDELAFCISDILPHMAQEQMKKSAGEFIAGEDLDLIIGLKESESDEKDAAKKKILSLITERTGMDEKDFQSAELEIVPAGKAKLMGFDQSMVLAYGQDDRVCAFTSLDAMLEENNAERTSCCLLVDKEEIGSVGATGMDSIFLENAASEVLARMEGGYNGLTLRRMLRSSYMLSSDVNSAYDPLNASLYDKKNASMLGGGVVFNKYTGSRGKSGASDANAEFIASLRKAMDEGGVKYQMSEMGKVDTGGGGTIAKYAAWYGMQVIDCGVAVLSMHSPWEITAVSDVLSAKECYKAFLGMR